MVAVSPHAKNLLPVPSLFAQKVWAQANRSSRFAKGREALPQLVTTVKKDQSVLLAPDKSLNKARSERKMVKVA